MFAALRMSAVMGMSLGPLERLAPGMIFAWTFLWLLGIVGAAVGRIGLRRSATRAPGGRRYASGPGLLLGTRPVIFPTGIGRQSAKLRGFGGGTPKTGRCRDLRVLQVVRAEANGHTPVQTQLEHHPTPALPRIDRLAPLVAAVAEADDVVIGHHPLLLDRQDRRQAEPSQRPVRVAAVTGCLRKAPVVRRQQPFEHRIRLGLRAGVGQTQFLDPAVLRRAERTLDASFGLR